VGLDHRFGQVVSLECILLSLKSPSLPRGHWQCQTLSTGYTSKPAPKGPRNKEIPHCQVCSSGGPILKGMVSSPLAPYGQMKYLFEGSTLTYCVAETVIMADLWNSCDSREFWSGRYRVSSFGEGRTQDTAFLSGDNGPGIHQFLITSVIGSSLRGFLGFVGAHSKR
jgi:hypothetical protein